MGVSLEGSGQMVLHLFGKKGSPEPVLTQLLFASYLNGVISKKPLHAPRSIDDAEGLLGRAEGGRLVVSEPNLCSCRHKRGVSSGVKGGKQGSRASEG